jgi:hypothetical protein
MSEPTPQDRFDRAVALFNDRAFFEAHEDWEALWHEAEGAERLWLQGLIQWAAAFVHFERGFHASGFVKLVREGRHKAEPYAGTTWGLDFPRLLRDLQPWFEHADRVDGGAPLVEGAPPAPPRMHSS